MGPRLDDDLDALGLQLLQFAVVLLRRRGRFFPFGAVVWAEDGETQLVAAPPDAAAADDPAGLLDALVAELRGEAAAGTRLAAAGTCVDVRADPELGQAIRADVEAPDGRAGAVLVAYERRWPRRFRLDPQPTVRATSPRIFRP